MDASYARALWRVLEPVHAVTYFAPECLDANKTVGLRGFWMGYFGSRAAPFGPVPAGVVEATFYNFHPKMVRRAVPDAWGFASPAAILEARSAAAVTTLRRVAPGIDRAAESLNPVLAQVIEDADVAGRPLFGANRDVPPPDDPVGALWQAATSLREHRGDGHIAALASEGLDGCEVHILLAALKDVSPDLLRAARGFSAEEWDAAIDRLATRGLVHSDGKATELGRALRQHIEDRTDELAVAAYRNVKDPDALIDLFHPLAVAVANADAMLFPNPMGLPRPT